MDEQLRKIVATMDEVTKQKFIRELEDRKDTELIELIAYLKSIVH